MDTIKYQHRALQVAHRIKRTNRTAQFTPQILADVGHNLGPRGIGIVPHGRHQAEHGAEGGTVV
jgi:hypothetical protein